MATCGQLKALIWKFVASERPYKLRYGKIFDVISPEMEMSLTQNLACCLKLALLLPVPNFTVISVSLGRFMELPPPQARNTLSIFLRNNNNRVRQSKIISSTSRLPDFFQKDAQFFIKLHIQVYPCHHVQECS